MNIYNETRSAGISYPLFCQGLKEQNEVSHGALPFSGMTQEKEQMKVSKIGIPHELWASAQSPWKLLLHSGGGNSENGAVEKAGSESEDVGNRTKEGREDKQELRFASQQIFWQDYLSGELDMEGFQNFLNTRVQNGIPDYTNVTEEGVCFDKEAVHFSKYVAQPFCEVIATTGKELMAWYRENVISKLEPTLAESDPVEYHYRTFGGRGQKLYYYKGKHYTFEEYYLLDLRDANEALAKAGNLVEGD